MYASGHDFGAYTVTARGSDHCSCDGVYTCISCILTFKPISISSVVFVSIPVPITVYVPTPISI